MIHCMWNIRGMFETLKEIGVRRELLATLIIRNLKIRYKGSVLGFLWSLLDPILMILLYGFFAHLLRFAQSQPMYLEFLMTGIISWQFLSMCVNDALSSIVGNSSLVKKMTFPRLILPLSTILANLVNFLLTLIILAVFLLFRRSDMHGIVAVVPAFLTQTALCLGLACIASAANVFFRDTSHMVSIAMLAWFFLSPVFYPIGMQLAMLPEKWWWLPYLNPMTGVLAVYRYALLGRPLAESSVVISLAGAWLIMPVGILLFRRVESRFAEIL